MPTYSILPKAPELIAETLKDLGMRPRERRYIPAVAIRERARFYMTPVTDRRGHVAWFKASLKSGAWLRQGLREEIRVQKAFADYERKYRPHFDSPSFIASHDNRRGFVWLLRKYWEGIFAGDMTETFGLSPAFFRYISPRAMATILTDVRKMTGWMSRRTKLDKHDLGWYLLDFHYYRRHFFAPLLQSKFNPGWRRDDVDRMEEIFHQHRSFLAAQAKCFSHGDFYPNNIMLRPAAAKPAVLFDWELSHLNLPTFDAAMLFLHAWRRPTWRTEFRRRFMAELGDTPTHRTAWRLSTLSLATRLTAFCFIRLTNGQPDRYPRLPKAQRPIIERLYSLHLKELIAAYTDSQFAK